MSIIESLLAGLRNSKSTVSGIFTGLALIFAGISEETVGPGVEVGMWSMIAAGVGAFIVGLVSRDADKSSEESRGGK